MSYPPQGNIHKYNPISGISTGLAQTEMEVIFPVSFAGSPHVVVSPVEECCVWVSEIYENGTGFKWNNNKASGRIDINWIADLI